MTPIGPKPAPVRGTAPANGALDDISKAKQLGSEALALLNGGHVTQEQFGMFAYVATTATSLLQIEAALEELKQLAAEQPKPLSRATLQTIVREALGLLDSGQASQQQFNAFDSVFRNATSEEQARAALDQLRAETTRPRLTEDLRTLAARSPTLGYDGAE